ncbi:MULTISPECIES: hypothetical protein [Streptomycetaceae]|uniref:hypothetical protein n=1 Tax=Streptomycetaceae TaxID=2062 RepID=UPI001784D235|nr:hypothetical protein [Streptomyces filipinensis]
MSAPARKGFSGQIKRGPMAADVIGHDFTMIFNAAVRDRRLSRRARGLLVEILSHRDGFGVSMASLLAGGPERDGALTTALRELERYGYLHRERERREDGTLGGTIFTVTDMPEGLSISTPAPWKAPEPTAEQNRRSEPDPENPGLVDDQQNRRSEPDRDFPGQAEPGQADPLHKKTNSSCGAEDDLSLARLTGADESLEDVEREVAVPKDEPLVPSGDGDPVEPVVGAYAAALGRPLVSSSAVRLRAQARELVEAGYPVGWLAERAAEMPAQGWTDLVLHAERSRHPLPGQQTAPPAVRPSRPPQPGLTGKLSPAARAILERASGL